jgi:hypothetical protein
MSWLKSIWEFLKMLPFFVQIYKQLKEKARQRKLERIHDLTKDFMVEVKGDNNASTKAKHLNSMFK